MLLREIIKWKRQMIGSRFRHSFGSSDIIYDEGNNKQDHYLAITALTGIASVHIGGVTLHSWAGIGMGKESAEDLASKILWSKSFVAAKARWKEVEMLIVDESKSRALHPLRTKFVVFRRPLAVGWGRDNHWMVIMHKLLTMNSSFHARWCSFR